MRHQHDIYPLHSISWLNLGQSPDRRSPCSAQGLQMGRQKKKLGEHRGGIR
jgi:hypothetical protein